MKRSLGLIIALLVLGAPSVFSQHEGPAFRAEYTSTLWFLSPSGSIKAGNTGRITDNIDLRSDLGVTERRLNDLMKVTLKFGDTHRIVVEGAVYQLGGTQDVPNPFKYDGTNFSLQDTIFSKPTVQYVFAGYARDLFSRELDHLGIVAGASYIRGKGEIQSLRTGTSARRTTGILLPIIGLNYQRNLTGIADRFEVSADLSGMGGGNTGHYVRAVGQVGARVWNHIVVHGGYGVLDLQAKRGQDSFDVRFRGPLITLEFRDR